MEKLEWRGYRTVKKVWWISNFDTTGACDRRTDGQTNILRHANSCMRIALWKPARPADTSRMAGPVGLLSVLTRRDWVDILRVDIAAFVFLCVERKTKLTQNSELQRHCPNSGVYGSTDTVRLTSAIDRFAVDYSNYYSKKMPAQWRTRYAALLPITRLCSSIGTSWYLTI